MSLIGLAAVLAASTARSIDASETGFPFRTSPASRAKSGVGATAPRPNRTDSKFYFRESSTTDAPAPTTAMSISFRGMNLR